MEDLIKVQCILESGYNDSELKEFIEKDRIYFVSPERARFLKDKKAVKIIKDEEQDEEFEKPRRKSRKML